MEITIQDIIKKYDVDIDLDKMTSKLKNMVVFSDKDDFYLHDYFGNVSLDDIKKPEVYEVNENYVEYTYKVKDGKLMISFSPNNYQTMKFNLTHPVDDETYTWGWDYTGTEFIY